MDQNRIQNCIEQVCQKGCAAVLETIFALEQNRRVDETLDLDVDEIRAMLSELKSIMAIYQK